MPNPLIHSLPSSQAPLIAMGTIWCPPRLNKHSNALIGVDFDHYYLLLFLVSSICAQANLEDVVGNLAYALVEFIES